jgi:hypothetical protein
VYYIFSSCDFCRALSIKSPSSASTGTGTLHIGLYGRSKALFENLESGARIDDFLAWFPGVTREMAEAVLEHAQRSLQTEAH